MAEGRVSFIHSGTPEMASYRYRAAIPAKELGWGLNEPADLKILAKPQAHELSGRYIADFCDDHFDKLPFYRRALAEAVAVTCPTKAMQERIRGLGREAHVVPDPYEYPEMMPHCRGVNLLWFGNQTNIYSLQRVWPQIVGYPLRVISNAQGAIPWSFGGMFQEFIYADIVIMPATKEYKSPNRAVESIRQGCFVVAEPHPSLDELPIWKGNIKEGIEWARANPDKANEMTRQAQAFISTRFSPRTQADAWRKVLASVSTSAQERSTGPDGLLSATAAR